MIDQEQAHDWGTPATTPVCGVVDETIRDGLQIPHSPALSTYERCSCVQFMSRVGIRDFVAGMYTRQALANNRDIAEAVQVSMACQPRPFPWILMRTDADDVSSFMAEYADRWDNVGANFFINVNAVRMRVEGWTLDSQLARLVRCLSMVADVFPRVRLAFEDATRTDPDAIARVLAAVKPYGIERIAIADTAGTATPDAVTPLVAHFKAHTRDFPAPVSLEWHGHNDRGLAVANSLQAWRSGCDFIHATVLGIGERNGNASLEQVMVNVGIDHPDAADWSALKAYFQFVRQRFGHLIAQALPFFGENSFATGTGTHSAAMLKAMRGGHESLARLLFSPRSPVAMATPPRFLVSPHTGRLGVVAALESQGMDASECVVDRVLQLCRSTSRTLHPHEIARIVHGDACIEPVQ